MGGRLTEISDRNHEGTAPPRAGRASEKTMKRLLQIMTVLVLIAGYALTAKPDFDGEANEAHATEVIASQH